MLELTQSPDAFVSALIRREQAYEFLYTQYFFFAYFFLSDPRFAERATIAQDFAYSMQAKRSSIAHEQENA